MSRYSFVCANGCGECGVKLTEFEYQRTETLSGELLSRKVAPQVVSTCCGGGVDVYDIANDTYMNYSIKTVKSTP